LKFQIGFQPAIVPVIALLTFVSPMSSHAGLDTEFVPNEVQVSMRVPYSTGISDPEFDSINDQYCWVDNIGRLWLGDVDPVTGQFIQPDGYGTLLATDAATVAEIGNGPEWVYTRTGPQIVYTSLVSGVNYLARAYFGNGQWNTAPLAVGGGRVAPIGSLDQGDLTPTITYQGPPQNGNRPVYVRMLTDSSTEKLIPTTALFNVVGGRPIPGTNAVIFTRPMYDESVAKRQVFVYDRDTDELEQLTFDGGNKKAVFMWQAPEYDNEYIFFVMVNERKLSIYRYLDPDGDGTFNWTWIQELRPPASGPFMWSPEPFVYNGKSYISMTMSTTNQQQGFNVPAEVWLTDLDPIDPTYRRLSSDVEVNRKDPEVYISDNGPYIYANWYDRLGYTTVYRLDTGIAP